MHFECGDLSNRSKGLELEVACPLRPGCKANSVMDHGPRIVLVALAIDGECRMLSLFPATDTAQDKPSLPGAPTPLRTGELIPHGAQPPQFSLSIKISPCRFGSGDSCH